MNSIRLFSFPRVRLPAAWLTNLLTDLLTNRINTLAAGSGSLCGLLFLGVVLIISFEVASRYLFNAPTTWVTEYSLYLFVGTSFLAAGYAQLTDSHIRVEILLNSLSGKVRDRLLQISAWIGLLFLWVAAWQMILFVLSEYTAGTRAWGLLSTPLWIVETPVAAGLAFFSFMVLAEARRLSHGIGPVRETAGLVLILLLVAGMAVWLIHTGPLPAGVWGTPVDRGTAVITTTVMVLSLLWGGFPVFAGTAVLVVGGGSLFAAAAGAPPLVQGGLLACFLLVLMAVGVRIAFSLGCTGAMGVLFLLPTPQLQVVAERAWTSVNSFSFTAIPMFILMGAFLLRSGVTGDLFGVMARWMGRVPGGLAHATVGACGIFAAVSGSSLATAATMGMTACPDMAQRGYSPRLAFGVVAAGGTLGILIPPSIAMIIYGSLVGEPIGVLFMAGIVPGIILSLSFSAVVFAWSLIRPDAAPRGARFSWREKIRGLKDILPFLVLITGVLGSLYAGVASPTEAGAVGALMAAVLCILKKKLTRTVLLEAVKETAQVTSFLVIIIAGASIMGYVFDYIRLPRILVALIQDAQLAPGLVMTLLVIVYIILGMFIDPVSMMLMTLSVSFPIVTAMGLHPVWFGVVLVMMIEIGLITPPVGVILFILKGMGRDVALSEIVYGVLPFVGVFLFNILLFYLFPGIVMWLPNLMAG